MDFLTSMPFLIGEAPDASAPLGRYLPPIPRGPTQSFLAERIPPGSWVLDPFGSSATLAAEVARAGYRVLVAANNPVARFLIEMSAAPPALGEFQSALAELSISRKENERLEKHILSLYLTECTNCRQLIPADSFIWEKKSGVLLSRVFTCPHCGESGEFPATTADAERAARWSSAETMHRARALERVAPRDDPDREYVAEATESYLPRAIYALWTLINRLDQLTLTPERRRALQALLLTTCDAANTLWPYPNERPRPRQLGLPAQFREKNVWKALEDSIKVWTGAQSTGALPVTLWPNLPPETGGICIFDGALRDLAPRLGSTPIAAIVGAIPRPNQAFWTLSALWAGWLWGREATGAFKVVLRRRRYDWQWHTEALRAVFASLHEAVEPDTPFFALLAEAEAPFVSAALGAAQAAGFRLGGIAMRTASDPLQILWEKAPKPEKPAKQPDPRIAQEAIRFLLAARGESVPHLVAHTTGVAALARANALTPGSESINEMGGAILKALDSPLFVQLEGKPTSPESGLWGLADGAERPFADQVEMIVVRHLQQNPGASYADILRAAHQQMPGLLTPSKALVGAVLDSYATEKDGWRLRDEDQPATRRGELSAMQALAKEIGARLGFSVAEGENAAITWQDNGQAVYSFHVSASALMGKVMGMPPAPGAQTVLVIPGGRAGLIAYKRKRDPSLREKSKHWHFLKYRHLRQIAELPLLTRDTWPELLKSDPIEQQSGQMMLF